MLGRVLVVTAGLGGAFTGAQFPEFAQQYRQRLGGAVDALTTELRIFDEAAQQHGLARKEAITRLLANADTLARSRGQAARDLDERVERLVQQQRQFADGGAIVRLAALIENGDRELARATLDSFEPALPVTPEGGLFALTGFLAGWLSLSVLGRLLAWPFRRRHPPASVPRSTTKA
jgi:hypothetical protein